MRIAFLSANREKLPDAVVPIGLLTVLGATPGDHEKVFWDLCFEPDTEAYLSARLAAFKPDIVAVGMRNIQNNDYSGITDNLRHYSEVFRVLRAHGDAVVVLGGGGFSVMPEALMRHLRPDYGVSGEGEGTFGRLVAMLAAGEPPAGVVDGLHHFDESGALLSGGVAPWVDLSTLPVPDRTLIDPRYYAQFGTDSIQTRRGCPLLCTYCTYPIIEGRRSRRRTPGQVCDELELLQRQQPGVRHFFITDAVFNLPPSHAKGICREMIRRGNTLPWTCYANPLGFDDELADLMVAAGCAGTEVGADSGTDEVLLRLKKGFDTQRIRQFHEIAARAGLKDCHTFILGTPGETLDDVHRTMAFIEELSPYAAIFMVWIDDAEALDPELAAARSRLRAQILELLEGGFSDNPRWIIPPLGRNFDERLFRVLRKRGMHGPLWQHIERLPT